MSANHCTRCLTSLWWFYQRREEYTLRSVQGLEPVMLWSKKRLKLLTTTVLSDFGRFHSFLLVIGCANTIKTEMTRLVKGHCLPEGSGSFKGSGFCEHASSLEMPLEMFKAFQTRSEWLERPLCCQFTWALVFTLIQRLAPFPISLPPALLS